MTGFNAQAGLTVKVQLTVREPLPPEAFPPTDVEHDTGVM